jgi:hypothetical protein
MIVTKKRECMGREGQDKLECQVGNMEWPYNIQVENLVIYLDRTDGYARLRKVTLVTVTVKQRRT